MKKGTVLVAAMLLSGAMSIPAYAGTWVLEGSRNSPKGLEEFWNYVDDAGNKMTNVWVEGADKASWYYVNEDGYMTYYEAVDIGDKTYWFDMNGIAFENVPGETRPDEGQLIKLTSAPSGDNIIYADGNGHTETNTNDSTNVTRKSPIEIIDIGVGINSADGASVYLHWWNGSGKAIKYISFDLVPYNAVGDRQRCEIRGYSKFTGTVTGPIEPEGLVGINYAEHRKSYTTVRTDSTGRPWKYDKDHNKTYYTAEEIGRTFSQITDFDCAWYNGTIARVDIIGIRIEYMDGTKQTVNPADVMNLAPELK